MRVPLSWLREWVDLPVDATPEDVLADLVRVGLEEEAVIDFGLQGPIVVGRVLEFTPEPQSNGKTIRWCQVDVGEAEPRGIVCGAANFFPGDLVAVTLPGAVLPGPFPIAARKTYGHVSDGMIASARELGLGDEHDGILRLAELGLEAAPGTDAIALLGLDDRAVDVNVTPDRGYAFSVRGIAREYSHATGAVFRDPASLDGVPRELAGVPITASDDAPIHGRPGVTQFVARVVRGIDSTRPSPAWMVARLTLAGIRSISLPVDVTNYVMLELGNPLHAYDLATLTGGITIRRAQPGEQIETLDGQSRTLSEEDLVIADDAGAIGIAGVMGGAKTEISDATTDVLIEAATFDAVSIARSARRHRLPSEASKRFERTVDPALAFVAAHRAATLLAELAGGTVEDHFGGSLPAAIEPVTITLPTGFVQGLIGVEYSAAEIVSALEAIGCTVTADDDAFTVTRPTWRPDLTDRWTLAEEVVRIHGLDRVPSVLPTPPSGRGYTPAQQARRRAADALAATGFVETLSFPFTSVSANNLHGSATGEHLPSVQLSNPIAAQQAWLRRSVVPGLLQTAHRNLARGTTDLALFEIGTVFLPEARVRYGTDAVPVIGERPSDGVLADLAAAVPPQRRFVGLLLAGNVSPKQPGRPAEPAGLEAAFDAVRAIARAAGTSLRVVQTQRAALHPGRAGDILVGDTPVGYVGELLPQVAREADLVGRVTVAEIDLDALIAHAGGRVTVAPLSTYPAATQDVSLIVPTDIPASDVAEAVADGAGDLLETSRLVDVYHGDGVADGMKSLTFALRFRASDRTLTAAEATEAKLSGVAVATDRFGATLRE